MEFGVAIPNFGARVEPEQLYEWATVCDEAGFGYAMVTDHIAQTPDVRRVYNEEFLEPFTTLAYIAAVTKRIRVGTTVTVVPLRHPLETARAVATIDRLAGGRLVLGVGVGGAPQEYTALGVPYAQRGAIADEYLDVLAAMWSAHREYSYHGRFVAFDNVLASPAPSKCGGPEIWVGGSSGAALRRAARYAAWHPTFPNLDELISVKIPQLRTAAEKLNRPMPAIRPRLHLEIHDHAVTGQDRPAGVGSPRQISDDLHRLHHAGIAGVIFDPVRHPAISRDAPASRTDEQNRLELMQIGRAATEIVNLSTGTIRASYAGS